VDTRALAVRIAHEIDEYRYEPGPGLLGRPWNSERVQSELEALRAALVSPMAVRLSAPDTAADPSASRGPHFLVARDGAGNGVFYDQDADEFGLAHVRSDGALEPLGVRGDLVGVFMAR